MSLLYIYIYKKNNTQGSEEQDTHTHTLSLSLYVYIVEISLFEILSSLQFKIIILQGFYPLKDIPITKTLFLE